MENINNPDKNTLLRIKEKLEILHDEFCKENNFYGAGWIMADLGRIDSMIQDHKGEIILAKRTIENCSLIAEGVKKGIGEPGTQDNKCIGYAGADEDEPCTTCKECNLNIYYEVES